MVESPQGSESGKDFCVIWITGLFLLFLIVLIISVDLGKLGFLVLLEDSIPFGDKLTHFFLIGILSYLVNRTVLELVPGKSRKRISMIFTLSLMAIFTLEEFSQLFIPDRNASLADLAANYAGILIFALFAHKIRAKPEATLVTNSRE
jgi:hypothetical protein